MRHTKVAHGRLTKILTVSGVGCGTRVSLVTNLSRFENKNSSRINVINGLSA